MGKRKSKKNKSAKQEIAAESQKSLSGLLKENYVIFLLAVVFILIKLIGIKTIFTYQDESDYVYWSVLMRNEPFSYMFYPLHWGGVLPLFFVLGGIMKIFINDPLVSGRFLTILCGTGSMIGLYFLALKLFDKKVAFLTAIFYFVSPFMFFYDRVMMYDVLLKAFWPFIALASLLLVERENSRYSHILGVLLGLALITKQLAVFMLAFLPLAYLVRKGFDFKRIKRWDLYLKPYIIAALITLPVYYVDLTMLTSLTTGNLYRVTNAEELNSFLSQLTTRFSNVVSLLTLPFAALFVFALIRMWMKKDKNMFLVLLWLLSSLSFIMITNSSGHHISAFIVPFYIIAAWGFSGLVEWMVTGIRERSDSIVAVFTVVAALLISANAVILDYQIVDDLERAAVPGYIKECWLYGSQASSAFPKILDYIDRALKRDNKKLVLLPIINEANANLFPAFYYGDPRVQVTNLPELRAGMAFGLLFETLEKKDPQTRIILITLGDSQEEKMLKEQFAGLKEKEKFYNVGSSVNWNIYEL